MKLTKYLHKILNFMQSYISTNKEKVKSSNFKNSRSQNQNINDTVFNHYTNINMRLITYWSYEELFNGIMYDKIYIPTSSLIKDINLIDDIIDKKINQFEIINAVAFSSFLNMISQTKEISELINLSSKELQSLNINPKKNKNGILFHRLNLLYIITTLIKNNNKTGKLHVTGNRSTLYYSVLTLINSRLGIVNTDRTQHILVTYFLRDHPYSYLPDITSNFYNRWLKRYWHIYQKLLVALPENESSEIKRGLKTLTEYLELTLK